MSTQTTHDPLGSAIPTLFSHLQKTPWFQRLLAQTKTLQMLQQLFDQECPLEVMRQCYVLGLKENCLTVGVANASIATQLQYRTRELISALKKYTEFSGLKKILVRIAQ